jgi:hypothetical protein
VILGYLLGHEKQYVTRMIHLAGRLDEPELLPTLKGFHWSSALKYIGDLSIEDIKRAYENGCRFDAKQPDTPLHWEDLASVYSFRLLFFASYLPKLTCCVVIMQRGSYRRD